MFDSSVLGKSKWKIDVIMPLMRKLKSENMKNCRDMNTEADVSVSQQSGEYIIIYIVFKQWLPPVCILVETHAHFWRSSLCGFMRGSGYETLSKRMPSVICLEYTRCLTVAVINNAVTTPPRWSKGIHFAASLSGGGLKAFWALRRTLLACEWRKTRGASVLKVTCGADFGKTTAVCDGTKYLSAHSSTF